MMRPTWLFANPARRPTRWRLALASLGVLALTACGEVVSAPLAANELRGELRVAPVRADSAGVSYAVASVRLRVTPQSAVKAFVAGDPTSGQVLVLGPTPGGEVTVLRVPPVRTTRLPADAALRLQELEELRLPSVLRWRIELREGVLPSAVQIQVLDVQRVREASTQGGRVLVADEVSRPLSDWASVRLTNTP